MLFVAIPPAAMPSGRRNVVLRVAVLQSPVEVAIADLFNFEAYIEGAP